MKFSLVSSIELQYFTSLWAHTQLLEVIRNLKFGSFELLPDWICADSVDICLFHDWKFDVVGGRKFGDLSFVAEHQIGRKLTTRISNDLQTLIALLFVDFF